MCYKHPNKVLIHGVIRRGGRGVPCDVKHEEVKENKAQALLRGNAKEGFLGASLITQILLCLVFMTLNP